MKKMCTLELGNYRIPTNIEELLEEEHIRVRALAGCDCCLDRRGSLTSAIHCRPFTSWHSTMFCDSVDEKL